MEYSPELAVLRLFCKDKKYLDKYTDIVYPLIIEEHLKIIYNTIKEYYTSIDNHMYISKDELCSILSITYSSYKDINTLLTICNTIYSLDISDSLSNIVVERLIERSYANKIINKLLPVITENKHGILSSVEEELSSFNRYVEKENRDSPFVEDDIGDILAELVGEEGGLKWKLQCLQDDLGSLSGGILGHIFARPNAGKTSLLASEITNFARQLNQNECILWLNNEERGRKVKARLYNAMLGVTSDSIWRNVEGARAEYIRRNGQAIRLYDSGIISFSDIRELMKEYNPRLIVIDQADKIHFKGMSNLDLPIKLKELYKHYRELAKEYDLPIITVGQASSEAEGKKWLRPDWMDYSKCLATGTNVLMYDGSSKAVESITIGDLVMGPDSTSREVVSLDSGISDMYRITHTKSGDSYVVNKNHILSLKTVGSYSKGFPDGAIRNIALQDYLSYAPSTQMRFSGYYTDALQYSKKELSIDPYFFGVWLGDGFSAAPIVCTNDIEIKDEVYKYAAVLGLNVREELNSKAAASFRILHLTTNKIHGDNILINKLREDMVWKNKHIPNKYLTSSIEDRLELLAGIIDTDGCLERNVKQEYYTISTKYIHLAKEIRSLVRGLGIYCTIQTKITKGKEYYILYISGNNIQDIPCRIRRKKSTYKYTKDVLRSALRVESVGRGTYAGFTLKEKDARFILADSMIVTHNTGKYAEMDYIIGIGKSHDEGEQTLRFINVSKNKMKGIERGHTVKFDHETARYMDI